MHPSVMTIPAVLLLGLLVFAPVYRLLHSRRARRAGKQVREALHLAREADALSGEGPFPAVPHCPGRISAALRPPLSGRAAALFGALALLLFISGQGLPALVLGGMLLLGKRRARGTASLGDEEALRIITGEVARLLGPTAVYQPQEAPPPELPDILQRAGVLPGDAAYEGGESLRGLDGAQPFTARRLTCTARVRDEDGDWCTRTLFSGLWVTRGMGHFVQEPVGLWSLTAAELRTQLTEGEPAAPLVPDSVAFSRLFRVTASSAHDACYLLGPDQQERLLALYHRLGCAQGRRFWMILWGSEMHCGLSPLPTLRQAAAAPAQEPLPQAQAAVDALLQVLTALMDSVGRLGL